MKVKKILSLILALVMVFALAAPAFATSVEAGAHNHDGDCDQTSIEPRVSTLPCCGATEYYAIYRWDVKHSKSGKCVFGFSGCNDNHATKYVGEKCTACGSINYISYTESGYYCPTRNNYKYYSEPQN